MIEDTKGIGLGDVNTANAEIGSLTDYLKELMLGFMTQIENLHIDEHYWNRTVPIPSHGISAVKFDISVQEQETLYNAGLKATREKLNPSTT